MSSDNGRIRTAFVLGGGGYLGGYQVGILRALLERGIRPELVIGTSVGSIQGAMIAARPDLSTVDMLEEFWEETITHGVMKVRPGALLGNLARLRPALGSQAALETVLVKYLGADTHFEDLAVPYQAVAGSIERGTARYFDYGPLLPAVLASSAIPGLWPPVEIGDEHFVDGGVVETVPLSRAIACGAEDIYVLRLRQREQPLTAPRWPWQLGKTVFELSRRHRLGHELHRRPDGVNIHLIPTGEDQMEPPDTGAAGSKRHALDTIRRRVDAGYVSACAYLDNTGARRAATVRGKARATIDQLPAQPAGPTHPFVAAKIHHYFRRFDHDNDGRIGRDDLLTVAAHVADLFGRSSEHPAAIALAEAYGRYWSVLHQAAGTGEDLLDHPTFARAMARLTADDASYDSFLHPLVATILTAADDGEQVLTAAALARLLAPFNVSPGYAQKVLLRMDTNGDGVVGLDEIDEAFHNFLTSPEPRAVGNDLFGPVPVGNLAGAVPVDS